MATTIDGTDIPVSGYFEDGEDGYRVPSFTFEESWELEDQILVRGTLAKTRYFRRIARDVWQALPAAEQAKFRREMAIEMLLGAAGAAAEELGLTVTITPHSSEESDNA